MFNPYLEPPEDKRKIVNHCDNCNEGLLELEEAFSSADYQVVFCSEQCANNHFGIVKVVL